MPHARKCPVRNSTVNLTDKTPVFLKATCWSRKCEDRQAKQSVSKIIREYGLQRTRNSSVLRGLCSRESRSVEFASDLRAKKTCGNYPEEGED